MRQDQYHDRAQAWALHLKGRLTTSSAVLLETANALARPAWRAHGVALLDHVQQRPDVTIVALDAGLWQRGWELYRSRPDKAWSLTDCISFLVMQDVELTEALTTDEHYRQASFRALLLDDPEEGSAEPRGVGESIAQAGNGSGHLALHTRRSRSRKPLASCPSSGRMSRRPRGARTCCRWRGRDRPRGCRVSEPVSCAGGGCYSWWRA